MTNSTQVLKPDLTERVIRAFSIVFAGAILVGAGWFGHASWTENALQERGAQLDAHEARLDAYEIELKQWATQTANEEFTAKREALVDELYNQTCVVPPGTVHFGNAATFQYGSERLGVLIDGTC
jgi:hypothetical protein